MTTYALCLGVGDYSGWRAAGWAAADLPYALKNAEDFAALLSTSCGFDPAHIGIQRDAWCNSGTILAALADLLAGARPGDVVCVFFSGHGTRIQGLGADGRPVPDLWYDAILPHAGALITDFDLAALAGAADLGSLNLTFVLDTAHTGGPPPVGGLPQTAGLAMPDDLAAAFVGAPRTLVPPGLCLADPATALAGNLAAVRLVEGRLVIDPANAGPTLEAARSTLLAACAPDQCTWQVPALENSVFVAALKSVVAAGGATTSYSDLLAALRPAADDLMTQHVRAIASYAGMASVPQLHGAPTRLAGPFLTP